MKTLTEWSLQFDLLYNNITSNKAPGLEEYEKSVFLSDAELSLMKDVFTAKGNALQEGIDDSERRQSDFRSLITSVELVGEPTPSNPFNKNSNTRTFQYPNDMFVVLNEEVFFDGKSYIVVPLSREVYARLRKKPYKYPPKGQIWRLETDDNRVELISNIPQGSSGFSYQMRYVKRPTPIILTDLPQGLSIWGVRTATNCTLPEHLHDEILQRAVLLAKLAWNDAVAPHANEQKG